MDFRISVRNVRRKEGIGYRRYLVSKKEEKVIKNVTELLYMINKLEPEEFLGVCKILGVEIYVEDLDDEKRAVEQVGMLRAAVPSEEGLVVSEEDTTGRPVRIEKDKDPNLQKMPRKAEDMIKDVVEKITELNRVQRKNLKKLLKAATKGDK